MHKNHRRKNKQDYPWDNRPWKCRDPGRALRAMERAAMQRLLAGEDPDNLIWPCKYEHVPYCDPWNWD